MPYRNLCVFSGKPPSSRCSRVRRSDGFCKARNMAPSHIATKPLCLPFQHRRPRRCWQVLLLKPLPLQAMPDAALLGTHGALPSTVVTAGRRLLCRAQPIALIARDSSKPSRGGTETWLLHAGHSWSEAHLEDDAATVTTALLHAFAQLGGPAPPAFRLPPIAGAMPTPPTP